MSKINGNDQAMPMAGCQYSDGSYETPSGGLTIRQHFAAMAMQGLVYAPENFSATREVIAADAVKMAEALIAELNK